MVAMSVMACRRRYSHGVEPDRKLRIATNAAALLSVLEATDPQRIEIEAMSPSLRGKTAIGMKNLITDFILDLADHGLKVFFFRRDAH